MARYVCGYCRHVYDEAEGDPDSGIAPACEYADRCQPRQA
ncbi:MULTISPECIES: rubredoxin [Sphingobium]